MKNVQFNERYKTGNIPWNLGRADFNLCDIVLNFPIYKCNVLDIGCGTGDNAIWLAKQGFTVTGIDSAEVAINMANEKTRKANLGCSYLVSEFPKKKIQGGPFQFIFDRGCFHTVDIAKKRKNFAKYVFSNLDKKGIWLSLIGNADEIREPDTHGPPQRSAQEIVLAVESYFEILLLKSGYFDTDHERANRAWICLMKRRE